jgi:CheY-like chemotaxis protein
MRILLIDDEEDVRTIATLSLARVGGMEVRTAPSGPEGLAAALESVPDAVLMDRMMPGMDGVTTFVELRKFDELRDVPVIFVTATAMPADVEELMAMGAAGVITKPFNPMTLASQVKQILERA